MNQYFIQTKIFFFLVFLLPIIGQSQPHYRIKKQLFQDSFETKLDTKYWFCEIKKTADNNAFVENGQLVIDVSKGTTVWFKKKLKNKWLIEFDRTVPMQGGRNDRLSDFNLFWQATDPHSKPLFGRDPDFEHYDSLSLYYVGVGGNYNSTTRFRKYQGNGERTLLQEYADAEHLLVSNKTYHCQLIMLRDTISFYLNNVLFFTFKDPNSLKMGYFGFRTTQSRHLIDNFKVYKIN